MLNKSKNSTPQFRCDFGNVLDEDYQQQTNCKMWNLALVLLWNRNQCWTQKTLLVMLILSLVIFCPGLLILNIQGIHCRKTALTCFCFVEIIFVLSYDSFLLIYTRRWYFYYQQCPASTFRSTSHSSVNDVYNERSKVSIDLRDLISPTHIGMTWVSAVLWW